MKTILRHKENSTMKQNLTLSDGEESDGNKPFFYICFNIGKKIFLTFYVFIIIQMLF